MKKYNSWCKHCGCGLDKHPYPTGNVCTLCKRQQNIINSYKYRKNAKIKRSGGNNTKGLPKD